MSAGHDPKSPHLLVPTPQAIKILHFLLTSGDALELMKRWQRLDIDHDMPYLAGYNVQATVTYADRDFINALHDPAYAKQIIGEAVDTGLSPDRTLDCIVRHEHVEKTLLDSDGPVDLYDHHDSPHGWGAHEYATLAEHELVKHLGGDPAKYERGLAKIIAFCTHKPIEKVPNDLACAPFLDDPDKNAKRILAKLKELGVKDADKVSKISVDYGPGTSSEHCSVCSMWAGPRTNVLAKCTLVDGLVRNDRYCKKFEPAKVGGSEQTERPATRPPQPEQPTMPSGPSPSNMRRIQMIRHGSTDLNNEDTSVDRIRGQLNVPLNREGRQQAKKTAKKIAKAPPDALVSSDLERAHETAKIVSKKTGVPVSTVSPHFRPWDAGELAGQLSSKAVPVMAHYAEHEPDKPLPGGGESFNQFRHRFLTGVSGALDQHPKGTVAIVAHHRNERLLHAWKAAGYPPDGRIDMPTFNSKGETTGAASTIDLPHDRLQQLAANPHPPAQETP